MGYEEIENKVIKKTRKSHGCCWCGEAIEKGSTCQYRVYVFDGDFNKDWTHPECYEAMGAVDVNDLLDGWMSGDYKRGSTVCIA